MELKISMTWKQFEKKFRKSNLCHVCHDCLAQLGCDEDSQIKQNLLTVLILSLQLCGLRAVLIRKILTESWCVVEKKSIKHEN